ncbi:MAG: DUF4339 domain-containing protein [Bdellovibrionales bacterium]
MALWYYLLKGRPHGPVTLDDVKNEISSSNIGANDLLYKEADTVWRMANSFDELGSTFKSSLEHNSQASLKNLNNQKDWVLLLRKEQGGGYKQRGPYSQVEIMQKLKAGEISYTDYVWRQGLKEWYKIIALTEFQSDEAVLPARQVKGDGSSRETQKENVHEATVKTDEVVQMPQDLSEITIRLPMPIDDDLKAIVGDKTIVISQDEKSKSTEKGAEKNIAESSSKNATESQESVGVIKESDSAIIRQIRRGKSTVVRAGPILAHRMKLTSYLLALTPVKRIVFTILILGFFVGGLLLFTFTSTFSDRKKNIFIKPMIGASVKSKNLENLIDENNLHSNESESPELSNTQHADIAAPAPEIETRVAPTFLNVIKIDEKKPLAILKISTDASSHYNTQLTLSASGGDVLGYMSFRKTLVIKGLENRNISIRGLNLPSGRFKIMAKCNDMTTNATLDFENSGPEFAKKINAQRKKYIIFHNNERFNFIRLADLIEKESLKLYQGAGNNLSQREWSSLYRSWKGNISRLKSSYIKSAQLNQVNNYLYTELWVQLRALKNQLLVAAEDLNRKKSKNRELDAKTIKSSVLEVSKLKEQMIQTSLWRYNRN